jgi:hypothetical protein
MKFHLHEVMTPSEAAERWGAETKYHCRSFEPRLV